VKIIEPKSFTDKFEKLFPSQVRQVFKKKIVELKDNPTKGRPLSYAFIRELKSKGYRVYYVIYDEKVILVDCGNKKTQGKDITKVKGEKLKGRKLNGETLKEFKYVKESSTEYMAEKNNSSSNSSGNSSSIELRRQNELIEENNKLLKSVLEALDDVKHGRYKVL
jgi:putative component of toxin-antitoxin plasmid stabilization module